MSIQLDVNAANIGITRSYPTVVDLVDEVGNDRIWGGVHFRTSVGAGVKIAERLVRFNLDRNFRHNK